ncbi:putative heat shock 70 kDa protein 12A [Rhizoctonia solani 123E]|uniref:Putative heat shock 70 kDa protein 12A n=1 Tax=Rhizoctonia solani 123E TaxID=1423351 RepID=A0A074SCU4_9AGAM|nr:putative heat shock 70 kDa protein 12A [Rhizoctonia solani 123E]
MSYGIAVQVAYDPHNPEHQGRNLHLDATGQYMVSGEWFEVAKKDSIIKADGATRQTFWYCFADPNPPLRNLHLSIPLLAIADSDNTQDKLNWAWNKDGYLQKGFERICTVTADLSGLRGALIKKTSTKVYYQLDFFIALHLGGTEINASIEWTEKVGNPWARKARNSFR